MGTKSPNQGEKPSRHVRRKDLGIAGALVILAESLTSFYSSKTVTKDLADFKHEFHVAMIEREQFFVRKTEVKDLSIKLDSVNDHLMALNTQVMSLKTFLKTKYGYSILTNRTFGLSLNPSYASFRYPKPTKKDEL